MTMKPEQWQAVIDINLSGVFFATKAAASAWMGTARLTSRCVHTHAPRDTNRPTHTPPEPPTKTNNRRDAPRAPGPHHQHVLRRRADREPGPGQLRRGQGRRAGPHQGGLGG